ncbi:hypothetical protein PT974_00900 [Cladobotryum mycophilum]|uniref:Uncharacterized protein n=1 Tax=Cladobotryum mycophilum TaxID=491253 RepID=A0ABR0T3K4_9HYPO
MPSDALKPISTSHMTSLAQSVITLINACEDKYIVLGDEETEQTLAQNSFSGTLSDYSENYSQTVASSPIIPEPNFKLNTGTRPRLRKRSSHSSGVEEVQLNRQIDLSNAFLLELLIVHVRKPIQEFQASVNAAVALLMSCLAYCYDVRILPSGARTPKGIRLEEIDLRIDAFADALELFDQKSAEQLQQIAMHGPSQVLDFMPRMETFLISSFLLAFRQSSMHLLKMLRHARELVEERQNRPTISKFQFPKGDTLKWLWSRDETDPIALLQEIGWAGHRAERQDSSSTSTSSSSSLTDETGITGEEAGSLHNEDEEISRQGGYNLQ